MATQTRDTRIYRPEFIVHSLNLKYTDASAVYNFPMGAGVYYITMMYYTVSQFVGSSGTVALSALKPALTSAQDVLSDSAFSVADANTAWGAGILPTVTMNRTTDYRRFVALIGTFGTSLPLDNGPWDLPYGLSLAWTNGLGGGSAGELQIYLSCGRIS